MRRYASYAMRRYATLRDAVRLQLPAARREVLAQLLGRRISVTTFATCNGRRTMHRCDAAHPSEPHGVVASCSGPTRVAAPKSATLSIA